MSFLKPNVAVRMMLAALGQIQRQLFIRVAIALALVGAGSLAGSGRALAHEMYSSRINVQGTIMTQKDSDDTGKFSPGVLVAYTGTAVSAKIGYHIGNMDCPSQGGTCQYVSSAITQPEYSLQCVDSQTCSMPPGLHFQEADGTISGTPVSTGVWRFRPGVRDKEKGEKPYRGNGDWGTYFGKVDGKTFALDESMLKIIVLAPPGDKEVKLTCSPGAGTADTVLLTLDLANGYIFELGNTATPGAIRKIDPNSDILGWTGMLHGLDFTLDRTTGNLRGVFPGSQFNWHCEKRSAARAF
jgi:hypothetical protein